MCRVVFSRATGLLRFALTCTTTERPWQ